MLFRSIDYLLAVATPLEVWFAVSDRKLEQDWAETLAKAPFFRSPIPRFGSSDYRRSRTSHLFYAKRRPSFRWFEELIKIGWCASAHAVGPSVSSRDALGCEV